MNTPSLPFNRDALILSWYGNRYALGGSPKVLEQVANILTNYDDSPTAVLPPEKFDPEYENDPTVDRSVRFSTIHRKGVEVHKTHKTFGYIIGEEADFVKAFTILRRLRIPRTGKRPALRRALKLARSLGANDFIAIKRENFLLGQNAARNAFAAGVEENAQHVATVDGDRDWQADVFERGATKALKETTKAA